MASTYTSNKAYLEKPANGDQVGSWDTAVNANWTVIDKAFGGSATASVAAGDWTVSQADAQNLRLAPSGTLTTNRNVILPATYGGFWLIANGTTGAYTVTVKPSAGSGVTVQQGYTTLVYSDGSTAVKVDNGDPAIYLPLAGGTVTGATTFSSTLGVTGTLTAAGAITCASLTASGNVTAYSDMRLKEDVSTIFNAVELVRRMRGVRYQRHGRKNVGVIAQEVEEVLPEVVETDLLGFKSVAYGNIVSVLIEAVKELSARVEYLEKRK